MATREIAIVNPSKRRKTSTKRRKTPARKTTARRNPTRRASPARRRPARRTRRVRRNPAPRGGIMGLVNSTFMPSVMGAGGALGLDVMMGMLPLPANMTTGPMRHAVKGVGAVGLGMLTGMVARQKTARDMTQGALTVVMHDAAREFVQQTMPNLQLGMYGENDGMGYVSSGFNPGYGPEQFSANYGMGAYIESQESTNPVDDLMQTEMGAYSDVMTEGYY